MSGGIQMQHLEGLTVQEYRKRFLNLKQSEIAEQFGCSQPWISDIERGSFPYQFNERELERLLSCYQLRGQRQAFFAMQEEFRRRELEAKKLAALQKPIAETEPLMEHASGAGERVELPDAVEDEKDFYPLWERKA